MIQGFVYSSIVSLINLDTTSFVQSSVSRPSFAGLIFGFIIGRPFECFILGIILELVILDFPPIGGMPVPNGCVGVGVCCYLVDKTGVGFSFFCGVISAVIYSYVEKVMRDKRRIFNVWVERKIGLLSFSLWRFILISLIVEFIVAAVYVFIFSKIFELFYLNISLDIRTHINEWLKLSLISTVFIALTSMIYKFLTQVRKNA